MTLQLADGTAGQVNDGHAAAARGINDCATSAPAGVDAGIGTSQALAILAACAGSAADLADVSQALAGLVHRVAADLDASDTEVATRFTGVTPGGRP